MLFASRGGDNRVSPRSVSRLAVTAPEERIDIADIPPEVLAELNGKRASQAGNPSVFAGQ